MYKGIATAAASAVALVLLSGCAPKPAANTLITSSAPSAEVAAALAARIGQDASGACLAAARLTWRTGGEIHSERGFYCADARSELPTAGSRYEIGSVSKTMLGAVYAQLQQEQKLNIEQQLREFTPGNIRLPQLTNEPVRLQHLLTHTSGLPRLPAYLAPADNNDPYADFPTEQLWNSLRVMDLAGPPGEQFGYSNFAYMLLSQIASDVAQQPLPALYQATLYEPLAMATASFSGDTLLPLSAYGEPLANWNFPENMAGVGGVRASLADMEGYLAGHLLAAKGDPAAKLPAATQASLLASQQPLVELEGAKLGWGWMYTSVAGTEYMLHGGGTGGFTSVVALNLAAGEAVVVLSNAALYQTGDIQRLAIHLLDKNIPPGTPYVPTELPSSVQLEDYAGTYPLLPGFAVRVFVEEQKLMIQGTNQPAAEVYFQAEDVFENPMFGARFVFERNQQGEVVALTLHQAGQQLRGERE